MDFLWMLCCSTMGVGRQSRRVCFGAKPDKGFLDKKISPYPEVVRGRERELTTRPKRGSWWLERRKGSWWLERRKRSWWLDPRGSWWLETSRGVVAGPERGVAAGQERGEQQKLAWKNGGAVNTRHRAERRGDKIGSSEEESQDVWFQ